MSDQNTFVASPEAKSKAKTFRIIAFVCWILAIGGQIYTIFKLLPDANEKMFWIIGAIVVLLALAITGNVLWKKSNKLDPASEKDKTRFFIQNQLGAIMGVLAFLPLVIMILTNKDMDGKTKGILGSLAGAALIAAGLTGVEFDPASVEKYTQEIQEQQQALDDLNITGDVHWAKSGTVYHLTSQCQYIRKKTNNSSGTVKDAFEANGLSELCKVCKKKAEKGTLNPD